MASSFEHSSLDQRYSQGHKSHHCPKSNAAHFSCSSSKSSLHTISPRRHEVSYSDSDYCTRTVSEALLSERSARTYPCTDASCGVDDTRSLLQPPTSASLPPNFVSVSYPEQAATKNEVASVFPSNPNQERSSSPKDAHLEDSLPLPTEQSVSGETSRQFGKQQLSLSPAPTAPQLATNVEPKPPDVMISFEETTKDGGGRGYGMLVAGLSLVLPRNTLYSFCPHQSENFRDRLLIESKGAVSTGRILTQEDRPPLHPAGPLQPSQGVIKSTKPSRQAGRIVRTKNAEVFPLNTVLPVPSEDALKDSIGKGGNGTVTYIYHKRREFAVKKTHFRSGEVDILHSLDHKNIVPLIAVMMGEEDPARPHRYYCYHFYPRMSGDVQSYLTRLGQGALSNVLMKHKDSPSMLQLVVDNVKHILGCVLRGVEYLHGNNIVHNDIKPSNVLVNLSPGCRCGSPIVCSCQQLFEVVITDFDSSVSVREPEKNKRKWSLVGTGGYRAPERYLQSLEFDETSPLQWKKGDIWSFGALVLKMFLSHYGPGSQRQVAALYLWRHATFPWNQEGKMADKVLKQELIKGVYPNWPQVWQLASDCMKISPLDRPDAKDLINHPFFSS